MTPVPFSLFKSADRSTYCVVFKDDQGKQLSKISTKKKSYDEALQVAYQWLRDGIPQKQNTVRVHNLSLRETVKSLKDSTDAETMIAELKKQGWLKSFVMSGTQALQGLYHHIPRFHLPISVLPSGYSHGVWHPASGVPPSPTFGWNILRT